MIYFPRFMIKDHLKTLRPAIILGIGWALALIGAAVGSTRSRADFGAAAVYQIASLTPTATPEAVSRVGSTDGIMVMGVIIVLIILIPIAFRRSTWTK